MSKVRTGRLKYCETITGSDKLFVSSQSVHAGQGTHPVSYSMDTDGRFSGVGVKLSTHLHLEPGITVRGALPPLFLTPSKCAERQIYLFNLPYILSIFFILSSSSLSLMYSSVLVLFLPLFHFHLTCSLGVIRSTTFPASQGAIFWKNVHNKALCLFNSGRICQLL